MLLTPHAGELTQLDHEVARSEVQARPAYHAVWLAGEIGATVLLKGPTTLIASPDGRLSSPNDGLPWPATAGSGDVLAGIAGISNFADVGDTTTLSNPEIVDDIRRYIQGEKLARGEVPRELSPEETEEIKAFGHAD